MKTNVTGVEAVHIEIDIE